MNEPSSIPATQTYPGLQHQEREATMKRDLMGVALMLATTAALLLLTNGGTGWKPVAAWSLCAVGWALTAWNVLVQQGSRK